MRCRQSHGHEPNIVDTFDRSLGRDHRQTIAAVSRLSAYMGRTGKGINHIFKGAKAERKLVAVYLHTYASAVLSSTGAAT